MADAIAELSDEYLDGLDDEAIQRLAGAYFGGDTLRLRYTPHAPTAKQEVFLRRMDLEAFFGGAAGPGKSWGLLMAALQFVDVPGYHALLLRPNLTDFEQPGALIEVSHNWLGQTDAWWNGSKRQWTFPCGATVRFGYLSNLGDLEHYKGPSYSFVGFDELTSFTEMLYRAMFRVLRQALGVLDDVPLRMRAASNPGGPGHSWVKGRFIDGDSREPGAVYVPARIGDNPHLDYEAYLLSLSHLGATERQRLIDGDWDVAEEGTKFRREWFHVVDRNDVGPAQKRVRYWDLAATEPSAANPNPDYTAGVRYQLDADGGYTITDVWRDRVSGAHVEKSLKARAVEDGVETSIYIEREPGASGKLIIDHYRRHILQGFAVYDGLTRSMDKETRATPVAAAAENGLVRVARCEHLREFLDQAAIFPLGDHDDLVDALSGAHTALAGAPGRFTVLNPNDVYVGTLPDPSRRVQMRDARYLYGDDFTPPGA